MLNYDLKIGLLPIRRYIKEPFENNGEKRWWINDELYYISDTWIEPK